MNVSMSWPQYRRQEVVVRGLVHKLDRIETEILATLLACRGRKLKAWQLIDYIWPNGEKDGALEQAVYSAAFRLRRRFPGLMPMVGGYLIPLPPRSCEPVES